MSFVDVNRLLCKTYNVFKGVAALEVTEMSLLYAIIDLNSHLRACPLHAICMCASLIPKQKQSTVGPWTCLVCTV